MIRSAGWGKLHATAHDSVRSCQQRSNSVWWKRRDGCKGQIIIMSSTWISNIPLSTVIWYLDWNCQGDRAQDTPQGAGRACQETPAAGRTHLLVAFN